MSQNKQKDGGGDNAASIETQDKGMRLFKAALRFPNISSNGQWSSRMRGGVEFPNPDPDGTFNFVTFLCDPDEPDEINKVFVDDYTTGKHERVECIGVIRKNAYKRILEDPMIEGPIEVDDEDITYSGEVEGVKYILDQGTGEYRARVNGVHLNAKTTEKIGSLIRARLGKTDKRDNMMVV